MILKITLKLVASTLFFFSTVSLAGVYSSTSPVQLAKEQEVLAKKIALGYGKSQDISQTIHTLKNKQQMLNEKVKDPELKNLLKFINICLNDIDSLSLKPHNSSNAQRIADLSNSISEGSRYIINSLQ